MTRLILAMFALALCFACGPREQATPAAEAPTADTAAAHLTEGTSLELRTSPLVELYFYVRAQAAEVNVEPPPGYDAAVDAARALQRSLGKLRRLGTARHPGVCRR